MKTASRLLAPLVLAALFSLAGCGGGGASSQADTAAQTKTTSPPLTVSATQTISSAQYAALPPVLVNFSGGVAPYKLSFPPACLPPGTKSTLGIAAVSPFTSIIVGTPYKAGSYQCAVTVQDGVTPPEVATQALTITITPPPLIVAPSLPSTLLLNRPFSGRVIATGGAPPYAFALNGSRPPGLSALDGNTGQLSGTPTQVGVYQFSVSVTDSSSPAQMNSSIFSINVVQPKGRNDSPASATLIGNGSFSASISPYIDPPNTPLPGDNDYYRIVSFGGATVHVETFAERLSANDPLDSVIEIVDGNGVRLSTCRQPGDTTTNFNSACINDDMSTSLDSALDFQVPGAVSAATTFYVHVLDWRGDGRPDMYYMLNVSGVMPPP